VYSPTFVIRRESFVFRAFVGYHKTDEHSAVASHDEVLNANTPAKPAYINKRSIFIIRYNIIHNHY